MTSAGSMDRWKTAPAHRTPDADSARISTPSPFCRSHADPRGPRAQEVHRRPRGSEGRIFRTARRRIGRDLGSLGRRETTLFRCILGELTPEAGKILIDGQEVGQLPTERRGIGVVYQSFALFPHLSVADNVGYGLRARKVPTGVARGRIAEMLDLVHLPGKENRLPRELSGGERQRVALARALCVGPKILLHDEAFGSLDATMRTQVVQEVRSIIRQQKVTTLFITHDQEEAFMFARRLIV